MSFDQNPYAAPNVAIEVDSATTEFDTRGLSKTATGLSMVYFGILILLASVIFGSVLSGAIGVAAGAGGATPFAIIMVVGMLVGVVLIFIGPIVCLAVPEAAGAKGLIIGSVVCQFVNLVGSISELVVLINPILNMVANTFGLASTVLFVLFMRKLALYIGRHDLAKRAKNVLVLTGLMVVGTFGILGLMLATRSPTVGVLFLAMALFAIIVFVMYANLVNNLRKALPPG